MRIISKAVQNKKPDFKKLAEYGFIKKDDNYSFSTEIMAGTFLMNVYVTAEDVTKLEITDKSSGEEYTLAYSENAVGTFIGAVRKECENVLNDIIGKCYEPSVFKCEYTKLTVSYIKDKYNVEAEYLWEKMPNYAAFRDKHTKKWFAAILTVDKRKLGIKGEGKTEIIDLKETPGNIKKLVGGKGFLEGYHMNKTHWYSVRLDGTVPIERIYNCIDTSFNMIKKV